MSVAGALVVVAAGVACEDPKPRPTPGSPPDLVSSSAASGAPLASGSAAPFAPGIEAPIVVEGVGFATPESVLYDSRADVYLVSNINGKPLDKDDNGFISRVSPDGKVLDLKWIDGAKADVTLHAPKGMALSGTELFVADLTTVRVFDRRTGKPLDEVFEIPGASFLNDVAPGPNGSVYVTDTGMGASFEPTGRDAIHYGHEAIAPLIEGKELGGPNGVVHHGNGAICVTQRSGELFVVDGEGKKSGVVKLPKGQLDGLVRLEDGTLLISSWEAGAIYRGPITGPFEVLFDGLEAPADIGYDHERRRVLIPLFNGDKVLIRPLPR